MSIVEVAYVWIIIILILAIMYIERAKMLAEARRNSLLVIRGEYREPGVLRLRPLPYPDFVTAVRNRDFNSATSAVRRMGFGLRCTDWRQSTPGTIRANGFQCLVSRENFHDKIDELRRYVLGGWA